MVTIPLSAEDVVHTRFSFSPSWEIALSYRVLSDPAQHAIYLPWVREAERALSGVDLSYLDALVGPSATHYIPDFLTPPPQGSHSRLTDEIAALRATPPEAVRHDVEVMLEWRTGESEVTTEFLERPIRAIERLAATIEAYWEMALAHHWPRIQAVLESDVLYRSRQLALGGAEALFDRLHPLVTYEGGRLRIEKHFHQEVDPGGAGLMLVPVLFSWPKLYVITTGSRQIALGYSPRGAGLWDPRTAAPGEALASVVGATRAAVLLAVEAPSSTGHVAERLGRSPGAISQILKRLQEAGLVQPLRQGRYVYYHRTQRGDGLVELFADG